ncbi:zinc transporter ZIP10-like isoform X1 [Hemitrygon akajei]|uniref:zinc transporter ZIP10-like isoform X1 n=1 Tax=Hemitrygon akajei TaxID=2704970 RepID=UPI003BF949B8
MKCGVLTAFLTGLLAVWAGYGSYCQAQTESGHKQGEMLEVEFNASQHSPPSKEWTAFHSAVTEQQYYLMQFFRLYGENGRLSFEGLRKLLTNLGLGEVQVVEIQHEDLGHDHVSHLDVLELQENKHVHSHTTLEHLPMPASGSQGHSLMGRLPDISAGASAKTSTSGSADRTQNKGLLPAPGRHHALRSPWEGSHRGERLERHRGKVSRSLADVTRPPSSSVKDSILNHSKYNHLHGNCLNVSQLLVNFGMSTIHEITPKQFSYICPALLYQIESRVCIHHHDSLEIQQDGKLSKSVWLWGFVAITLISLMSLVAIAIIPFLSHSFYKALLPFLVALAVGTLSADALLHLIPHAQDHKHKGSHNTDSRPLLDGKDSLWKGLSALGGIYLLFLIESLLRLFRNCSRRVKPPGKGRKKEQAGLEMDVPTNIELRCLRPAQESCNRTELDQVENASSGPFTHQPTSKIGKEPCSELSDDPSAETWGSEEREPEQEHEHGHSHHLEGLRSSGIVDIAWMVMMGDGMHNFTDGLAIGAAFSTGISGGFSTTIAVFCHELPHELGDFAVLMKAGVKMRQAVKFNLVSAVLSYLGMVLGIAAGQYTDNVTPWIFASTAGMFLYVALVDMLPEILHGQSNTRQYSYLTHFVRQNLGFLLGAGVMLCIALFEDRLLINISS